MIKKNFSKIGFSYLSIGIISIISQIVIACIIANIDPKILSNINYSAILSSICQYIIPIPLFYILIKKVKKTNIEKHSVGLKKFLIFVCITFALMYIGNMIGIGITEIISIVKQNSIINPISNLIHSSDIAINIILISFIAPIFEELFFRKMLIDRTIQYGAKISIFLSAFMFGLFHGNLNQFFYAFLLGGFFAIIYIKTGRIIYTMILHMITNFFGSAISPIVENMITSTGGSIFGIVITLIYLLGLYALVVIGIIFIIKWRDKVKELKNKIENPLKTSLINLGMICFIIYCLIEFIYIIII